MEGGGGREGRDGGKEIGREEGKREGGREGVREKVWVIEGVKSEGDGES